VSAIDRALDYTREGRQAFFSDSKTQDAVLRNASVIGEAVRGISEATRQAHPEIPWSRIGSSRVDLDAVWELVEQVLPRLRHQIAELLPVIKPRVP
jgi:uncharacterized protein with HEPN domain